MPSHVPGLSKPWRAKAKRNGIQYHLGYFSTKEQAQTREDKFADKFPKLKNRTGKNQGDK